MNAQMAALVHVNTQAEDMAALDRECEAGYAQLGWRLLEVAQMQYWRLSFDRWDDYLKSVAVLAKKTPAQLKQYFLTVRDLSDSFSIQQLENMGITKAIRLRQAKDYALVLPSVIINSALDPKVTAKDLKKIIDTTLKMPVDDDSDWMDCEMEFIVTPEQRATIDQAIDVAMHTEPLTKQHISKSAQMLDVMMKFAQEFLGSHFGDGQ